MAFKSPVQFVEFSKFFVKKFCMKELALALLLLLLTGLQVAAVSVKLKATSARILCNLQLKLGGTTLRIRNYTATYPRVERGPKLGLHAGLLSSNGSTLHGLTHTRGCCTCHVMD